MTTKPGETYTGVAPSPLEISVPLGISIHEFSTVVNALGSLYREVGRSLGVEDVEGLQVSGHREGSLVLECDPLLKQGFDHAIADGVSEALLNGLEELAVGDRPEGFTYAALKHAVKLTGAFTDKGSEVVVSGRGRSVSCGAVFRSGTQRIVNRKTIIWGSVEGNLQMISLRGRSRFNLYEMLTDERIECTFGDDLLSVARESLGCRVVVSGEIHKRGGELEHVKVERLRRRPPSDQLPGFAEIRGLFADA